MRRSKLDAAADRELDLALLVPDCDGRPDDDGGDVIENSAHPRPDEKIVHFVEDRGRDFVVAGPPREAVRVDREPCRRREVLISKRR